MIRSKTLCLVLQIVFIVIPSLADQTAKNDSQVLEMADCSKRPSGACFKRLIIAVLPKLPSTIELNDWISLTAQPPGGLTEEINVNNVDDLVKSGVEQYWKSLTFHIKVNQENQTKDEPLEQDVSEGRKGKSKKGKGALFLMMAAVLAKSLLTTAIAGIGAIAGKALIASLAAAAISAFAAIKTTPASKTTYEIISKPSNEGKPSEYAVFHGSSESHAFDEAPHRTIFSSQIPSTV